MGRKCPLATSKEDLSYNQTCLVLKWANSRDEQSHQTEADRLFVKDVIEETS